MDEFLLAYAGGEVHKKDIDFLINHLGDIKYKLNMARSSLRFLRKKVKPDDHCTIGDLECVDYILQLTDPNQRNL